MPAHGMPWRRAHQGQRLHAKAMPQARAMLLLLLLLATMGGQTAVHMGSQHQQQQHVHRRRMPVLHALPNCVRILGKLDVHDYYAMRDAAEVKNDATWGLHCLTFTA